MVFALRSAGASVRGVGRVLQVNGALIRKRRRVGSVTVDNVLSRNAFVCQAIVFGGWLSIVVY